MAGRLRNMGRNESEILIRAGLLLQSSMRPGSAPRDTLSGWGARLAVP